MAMPDTFTTNMEHIRADGAAQKTVLDSAKSILKAIAMQFEAAESAAKAAGASEEELAPVQAVRQDVAANADALASAIVANTSSEEAPTTMTQGATESTVVKANIPGPILGGLAAPAAQVHNEDHPQADAEGNPNAEPHLGLPEHEGG